MMARLWQQESVRRAAFILPFALLPMLGIVGAVALFSRPRLLPPVYRTSPSRIVPIPTEVCPGETISYTVQVDVRKAPSQVMVVETFWSVDEGRTAVFDDSPFWVAYTDVAKFEREFVTFVPALKPGRYELRSVSQSLDAESTGFEVPFTVRGDC